MQKFYVGNIPWGASEAEVRELFESVGPVKFVRLNIDRETGKNRGYAFVGMDGDAESILEQMKGRKLFEREVHIRVYEEREGDREHAKRRQVPFVNNTRGNGRGKPRGERGNGRTDRYRGRDGR